MEKLKQRNLGCTVLQTLLVHREPNFCNEFVLFSNAQNHVLTLVVNYEVALGQVRPKL